MSGGCRVQLSQGRRLSFGVCPFTLYVPRKKLMTQRDTFEFSQRRDGFLNRKCPSIKLISKTQKYDRNPKSIRCCHTELLSVKKKEKGWHDIVVGRASQQQSHYHSAAAWYKQSISNSKTSMRDTSHLHADIRKDTGWTIGAKLLWKHSCKQSLNYSWVHSSKHSCKPNMTKAISSSDQWILLKKMKTSIRPIETLTKYFLPSKV